jgi:hypothetical protein
MSWKENLVEDDLHVLDFLQLPSGIRKLKPRRAEEPTHEYAVFTSHPCLGKELREWRAYGQLARNVRLISGESFVLEAHGAWLTNEEFEFWRLPSAEQEKVSLGERPWINGMPPLFPEK